MIQRHFQLEPFSAVHLMITTQQTGEPCSKTFTEEVFSHGLNTFSPKLIQSTDFPASFVFCYWWKSLVLLLFFLLSIKYLILLKYSNNIKQIMPNWAAFFPHQDQEPNFLIFPQQNNHSQSVLWLYSMLLPALCSVKLPEWVLWTNSAEKLEFPCQHVGLLTRGV